MMLTTTHAAKSIIIAVSVARSGAPDGRDDYSDVVVMLDANTRVIAADIQWIIQKRVRAGCNGWASVHHFRSKAGLLFYAPKPIAPELLALPEWFPA
jgi:hypothetical protein